MEDTKEKLQKEYNDKEKLKKEKKANIIFLRQDILELEAEQIMLQERWNKLERKNLSK